MPDNVILLGAETVLGASNNMLQASAEMSAAASTIQCELDRQRNFMDDWLMRLQETIKQDSHG